jgi:lipopolysaccharide biosynthesis glycosyltransferase
MSSSSRLPVFFILSADYWSHATVTIASALAHADQLDLHIYCESVNPRWFGKIQRLVAPTSSTVTFHPFDTSLTAGLKVCGHLGLSTYYRIFIPDLFDQDAERLIYLDSDMVVCSSLHEIAHTPLGDAVIGAVPSFSRQMNQQRAIDLAHGQNTGYFNAGVLLIDLHKWKQEQVRDQCLAFADAHPERLQYADQDMLNYVLVNKYKPLPLSWNATVEMYREIDPQDLDGYSLAEIETARDNPNIVHFNGCFKPWHLSYRHPFKRAYTKLRRQLQKTPYLADDFPWPYLGKPLRFLTRQASR